MCGTDTVGSIPTTPAYGVWRNMDKRKKIRNIAISDNQKMEKEQVMDATVVAIFENMKNVKKGVIEATVVAIFDNIKNDKEEVIILYIFKA